MNYLCKFFRYIGQLWNIGQVVNLFYKLHSNKAITLAVFILQMLTVHILKQNCVINKKLMQMQWAKYRKNMGMQVNCEGQVKVTK